MKNLLMLLTASESNVLKAIVFLVLFALFVWAAEALKKKTINKWIEELINNIKYWFNKRLERISSFFYNLECFFKSPLFLLLACAIAIIIVTTILIKRLSFWGAFVFAILLYAAYLWSEENKKKKAEAIKKAEQDKRKAEIDSIRRRFGQDGVEAFFRKMSIEEYRIVKKKEEIEHKARLKEFQEREKERQRVEKIEKSCYSVNDFIRRLGYSRDFAIEKVAKKGLHRLSDKDFATYDKNNYNDLSRFSESYERYYDEAYDSNGYLRYSYLRWEDQSEYDHCSEINKAIEKERQRRRNL